MPDLTPEFAADVIAACQAGAEEAAGALSRALDGELTLSVGDAATYAADSPPDGFDGPGLAILMKFGDTGAVALLPASTGLLPDWIEAPDATGESKLSTLAQELSMLLVPETLMADDFRAGWVANLAGALADAELADAAGLAPLPLSAGEQSGQLSLVWPCAAPDALFPVAAEEEPPTAEPAAESPPASESAPTAAEQPAAAGPRITHLSQLPNYSRSLLRVEVPIAVSLASKKQEISEIIELGPGAIITFEKSCDDPIELLIGDEKIAMGEAVKVGEKFGVRITEMVLPDERFQSLRRPAG